LIHDVVSPAPSLAFVPVVRERNLFSGFAQDELSLTSNLALTFGTKVEHNDYTGFELEPNIRLQWEATANHMLWTAVSRAVRIPSRVDRDERLATPSLAPLVTYLLVGGPNFDSETVVAYEAGYRTQLGQSASLSLSAFYNDYDNLRSTSASPPKPLPFPLFFENNLEGRTYGLELAGTYQARTWWRLSGSYNFLKERIRVKPGRLDFNNALNETADPEHQSGLRSAVNLPKGLEFTTGLRWIDSFRFNSSGVAATVPSYTEVDARLAWRPGENIELSVVGQNLLHDHHLEYVISGSNPREEIRRNVYGKVTYRW